MSFGHRALVLLFAASFPSATVLARDNSSRVLFQDDFEHGLSKWIIEGRGAVAIHKTGKLVPSQELGDTFKTPPPA